VENSTYRSCLVRLLRVLMILLSFPVPNAAQRPESSKPVGAEAVNVTSVTTGLRKGSVSFSLVHGEEKAELIYTPDRRALFFSVAQGSSPPAASSIPAADKVRLLRAILEKVFDVEGRAEEYAFAFENYSEVGPRVAEAAIRSGGWDARGGRPVAGSADQFVKNLLNDRNLYSEFADLAGEFGYAVEVTDVENVIVEPAQKCDASPKGNNPAKVRGAGKVPCSMSIRFSIFRKEH
jgi:hypothetical protein